MTTKTQAVVATVLLFASANGAFSASVVAWGWPSASINSVTNVPIGLTNVVGIATGEAHNLALRSDGTLVAWGDNSSNQTNVPAGLSNVVAIAAGRQTSLALKSDGTVAAWGFDFYFPTFVPAGLSNVVAIAGGWSHSLALRGDGTVVVWSSDDVNSGDFSATNVPTGLSNVVAIATGGAHQCLALKSDGVVVGWGDDSSDQATPPPGLSNVVAVAAGNHPSLALKNDGTVVGWPNDMPPPEGLSNVMAIAAGNAIDLAVKTDGTVVKWGYSAQPPPPLGLSNVLAVGAGAAHSIALVDSTAPFDGSPFVYQSPLNYTASVGASAVFGISAVGSLPHHYQWRFNNAEIPGANRSTLLLTNLSFASEGEYRCVVSNSLGFAISPSATLVLPRALPRFDVSQSATHFTNGGFAFRLIGLSGHGDVVIMASTNLLNWTPILTNPPVIGELDALDATSSNWPSRFYRAEER